MSSYNPWGGTQQDLINMAEQGNARAAQLRKLVEAIDDIDRAWTKPKADQLGALMAAARRSLNMPQPVQPPCLTAFDL